MSREELRQVARILGIPLSRAGKSLENIKAAMNMTGRRPFQQYTPKYAGWYKKDDLVVFARASGIATTQGGRQLTKKELIDRLDALHRTGRSATISDPLERACRSVTNSDDFLAQELTRLHAVHQETRQKLAEAEADIQRYRAMANLRNSGV